MLKLFVIPALSRNTNINPSFFSLLQTLFKPPLCVFLTIFKSQQHKWRPTEGFVTKTETIQLVACATSSATLPKGPMSTCSCLELVSFSVFLLFPLFPSPNLSYPLHQSPAPLTMFALIYYLLISLLDLSVGSAKQILAIEGHFAKLNLFWGLFMRAQKSSTSWETIQTYE